MKEFIEHHEWLVVENTWNPAWNKISESIFSIGNGRFGQRANFEEKYSGDTLQGSYVAGVYYPDKTRVGWWKNGYPEYFAKVLNATNFIGIGITLAGEELDLAHCTVQAFRRELDMQKGTLKRSFTATTASGKQISVVSTRFCSMANDQLAAIEYSITPLNFGGEIRFEPYLDADVRNQDANYGDSFWVEIAKNAQKGGGYVVAETKKTGYQVCTAMHYTLGVNAQNVATESAHTTEKYSYIANQITAQVAQNQTATLTKYVAITSTLNHEKDALVSVAEAALQTAAAQGFDALMAAQAQAWQKKWKLGDVVITGDVAAQQGIRFNMFQLHQTYTGEDQRLNIGPKGFTGEKYGGSTYWDTEAYCLAFYLATAPQSVARNLLIYRHKHLQKAIENAAKLGFSKGAALYPMVTMNGEECHNEWEITFEEIHRNGAIAHAIFDYINYTNDQKYLAEYGLEVLIAIARFWAQRMNFSPEKKQYVILGVTGPNEYENNVNNNWYTNYLATWCLKYAIECVDYVKNTDKTASERLFAQINFEQGECAAWQNIVDNMYFPEDKKLGVFLQQDGFMDKEQILVKDLDPSQRPIHEHWSWDRVLRSVYIKQADVLQGLYFFEDDFDAETHRRNYDFYEPRTVHESSLSPCVHSILAAKLGDYERAHQFYLRTARLDLDDYNNDTKDGLHITSMAGSWLSVVQGFGGMRVRSGKLYLAPFLPAQWLGYAFKISFKGATLNIEATKKGITITNLGGAAAHFTLFDTEHTLEKDQTKSYNF